MKKLLKFFAKLCGNFWVQILFLLCCLAAVFALGAAFNTEKGLWGSILEFITGSDVLSVFVAALISVIVARVIIKVKRSLEDSLKIEDDHHKIISKYHKHTKCDIDRSRNSYKKNGEFMYLERVPENRKRPRSMVSNAYSEEYARREQDISLYYDQGRLLTSSINIFANIKGDTAPVFNDSTKMFELPDFIRDNAMAFLGAHNASSVNNSVTIRLNDLRLDEKTNTLTLDTCRTMYFHMLVTNRCMDYKANDILTVRDLYEFGPAVSPLQESKLGNQIGINGLIFTRDGYLLIEKRGKKKTTWKDKFAQPISLAMKVSDIGESLSGSGRIEAGENKSEEIFENIILKTINKNYGLTKEDILPFSLRRNFFGIARDLLEGGKPNMYFYIVADMDAETLARKMSERAKAAAEQPGKAPVPSMSREKLDRDLYIVRADRIKVDFGYEIRLKARDMIRIKRRYSPCVCGIRAATDGMIHKIKSLFGLSVKKECGEALLSCLYYADVCRDRLKDETHISV